MANDPYMAKTQALLRAGKARLDRLRAAAEKAAAEARMARIDTHRNLKEFETRYTELNRRFEQLRVAGTKEVADLKVGLEKALDQFSALDWKGFPSRLWSKRPGALEER